MDPNSIDAYYKILESGVLGKKRTEFYKALCENSSPDNDITAGEVFLILNGGDPVKALTQSRARATECVGLDVTYVTRDRPCKVTGHMVKAYASTGRMPREKIILTKLQRLEIKEAKQVEALLKTRFAIAHEQAKLATLKPKRLDL